MESKKRGPVCLLYDIHDKDKHSTNPGGVKRMRGMEGVDTLMLTNRTTPAGIQKRLKTNPLFLVSENVQVKDHPRRNANGKKLDEFPKETWDLPLKYHVYPKYDVIRDMKVDGIDFYVETRTHDPTYLLGFLCSGGILQYRIRDAWTGKIVAHGRGETMDAFKLEIVRIVKERFESHKLK